MASKKTIKSNEPKLRLTVRHALTNIYFILLFTFFPLFLSNYYSAARRDKFWVFLILTAAVGLSVGIITVIDCFTKGNEYNRKLNTYRDPFSLSATDVGFLAFFGVTVISTFTSGNILHCLTGLTVSNSGRNMGLITIFLLLVCYFVISRFFYFKKYILYFVFGGITVVSLLAILNYYYIDVLGLFSAYEGSSSYEMVLKDFTSTIGNKNYLSALICVALPFSFGTAIVTEDKIMRIIAYISTGIQFAALIVATSDGGFLGCFAAFLIIAVVISRDAKKLFRYFLGLAVMMLSAKMLWLFDLIMKHNSKGYTSFSDFFINSYAVYILFGIFAALTLLMFFVAKSKGEEPLPKAVLIIAVSVVCITLGLLVFLFIFFTFINKETTLTGFMRFFRFDERWGTHRGYFWIKSFEVFSEMNIWQKLFGTGPETFYFAFSPYFDEMTRLFDETSTNAAHNVYINYLVTHGIVGLLSYLSFIAASIVSSIKLAKNNPLALICLGVVAAYAMQDLVNIANPVNTPWFIVFIALSEATRLRANSTEEIRATGF
ncbi:MAG: O-antigen ligase family protein [Ruminococcus sp.]